MFKQSENKRSATTTEKYLLDTLGFSWFRFGTKSSSGPEKSCCKGLYSGDAIVLLQTCAVVVCRRVHLPDARESLITPPHHNYESLAGLPVTLTLGREVSREVALLKSCTVPGLVMQKSARRFPQSAYLARFGEIRWLKAEYWIKNLSACQQYKSTDQAPSRNLET